MSISIAVDAMGGDYGPPVTVPAAIAAVQAEPYLSLTLVGQKQILSDALAANGARQNERLTIHHASEVVDMDEPPAQALRKKKNSSMRVAINLVHDGHSQACVSAGNTGALMATARFVLKTLPGISRPAIVSRLPGRRGATYMLDLGANVDCSAELLLQFGVMGSILVEHVQGISAPRVALLNIGVEDIKGNDTIKLAAELFRASNLNYQGFIEGDELYTGAVDVVVCDGFVGNVALKASEGLAQVISESLREEFRRHWWRQLSALFALPALNGLRRRFDHRRYNGATLIGLHGTVIKSHGGADALAFQTAIFEAATEVREQVTENIIAELQSMLSQA
ncbi:MAG: phosphate acyltransferase PlsX [Gammaproteobacteria bacterium]|nr:phosphate acyltransferase PlsX [Gammaproteobacteria bacterium]MDH3469284.1 phosphate acyltransferase PlsX [Gammaproteobacteria bacterium]